MNKTGPDRDERRSPVPARPSFTVARWVVSTRSRCVPDAIAAGDPGDGIMLVATGSYLGEGFDWPELDTLFLAFTLAFKGRVVQYVGMPRRCPIPANELE